MQQAHLFVAVLGASSYTYAEAQTTDDRKLLAMRLRGMAESLKTQEQDPAARELSFLERLGLLVDQQWNRREIHSQAQLADALASGQTINAMETGKFDPSLPLGSLRGASKRFVMTRIAVVLRRIYEIRLFLLNQQSTSFCKLYLTHPGTGAKLYYQLYFTQRQALETL
jgi:hypothetical protein